MNEEPHEEKAQEKITPMVATVIAFVFLVLLLGGSYYLFGWAWEMFGLAFGLALSLRQLLINRWFDAIATLVLFGISFASITFRLFWDVLIPLPSLFIAGVVFLVIRETFIAKQELAPAQPAHTHEEPPPSLEQEH